MPLHEPSRHEALTGAPWSEERARETVARIVADTHAAFDPERLWTIHPFDAEPERPESLKTLYYGAGGVIWATLHLAAAGAAPAGPDYRPAVRELVERHRDDLRRNAAYGTYMGGARTSFLMGEAGMLMLRWKLEPSPELADEIHTGTSAR